MEPVLTQIFNNLFSSVAEEMGETLARSTYSANIKERRDLSCGIFDASGNLVAQAAHIPVHLGSMPLAVASALHKHSFLPGDVVILNDPFRGGTHLPDITLVSAVFEPGYENPSQPMAFLASRAHHADIGGISPGSMPLSTTIFQEGLIIPPVKLVEGGEINQAVVDIIGANSRTPEERRGDLAAQLAAHTVGEWRMQEIIARYGPETTKYFQELIAYSERMTRATITSIPDGEYGFVDYLDDDGQGTEPVRIEVSVKVSGDEMVVDFTGSSTQVPGCVNAVLAVTTSAVLYVIRCLNPEEVPANQGCLQPIRTIAPPGTVVNALWPQGVAGGNVETSQRIVDVLLGALAQALPEVIPAASQGTMNNLSIGGYDPTRGRQYAYYETLGGGMGASPKKEGLSGIHSHMTNTMNTPIEALEYAYPFMVEEYSLRRGSGGAGLHRGGDGLRRAIRALAPSVVTILSDRRRTVPYSLQGGEAGAPGRNLLVKSDGRSVELPSKATLALEAGDRLVIETPGGGGWGKPS